MQIVVAKSERDPRWLSRHHHRQAVKAEPVAKISSAEQAEVDRLLSLNSQVTTQIRRAFLDAIARLADQIDIEQIRSLLADGRVDQAIDQVNAQLLARGFTPVAHTISAAALASGQSAAAALTDLNVSFGPTNPQTINFLQTYEMGLIRGLTQDALQSVRTAIQNGVAAGRNPLDVARDIRAFIGLTPSQTQAVLNYRAALENLDSAALDRALRDARFDPTIESAIEQGTPLSQDYIDKVVARYAQRYLQYRAETIARTEAIRAVNAGNDQLWRQAVNRGDIGADQVVRLWITAGDHKVRDAHRAIPRMNPDGVGLNEPFDSPLGPIMMPGDPNAPPANTINCRCSVFIRYKARPDSEAA